MLVSYELKLDITDEKKYSIYNWGSIMQGVLLEKIDREYVEKLHNMKYNPYSQYIYLNKENEYIWKINTIGEEAYKKILEENILKRDEIFLESKNLNVKILEKRLISKTTLNDLFKKWFISDNLVNKVKYKIITPVSYKQDNKYLIIPDTGLILSNIINKWNAFSTNNIEKSIFEEYLRKTFISNYNIRTATFSLEKVRIKGYIGEIEITIKANQMMTNILNLLFEFAEYSGLGIKTSIGMGAIKKLEIKGENK